MVDELIGKDMPRIGVADAWMLLLAWHLAPRSLASLGQPTDALSQTNLAHFSRTRLTTRRRFQDFVFLRENLKKDFPACLVAPLPDKHRMGACEPPPSIRLRSRSAAEYFTGDRFSSEFIERRQAECVALEAASRRSLLTLP